GLLHKKFDRFAHSDTFGFQSTSVGRFEQTNKIVPVSKMQHKNCGGVPTPIHWFFNQLQLGGFDKRINLCCLPGRQNTLMQNGGP
ncbi:MAG: hypothetical protein ABIN89_08080, partial [Chitinophagaceae bacterium]